MHFGKHFRQINDVTIVIFELRIGSDFDEKGGFRRKLKFLKTQNFTRKALPYGITNSRT